MLASSRMLERLDSEEPHRSIRMGSPPRHSRVEDDEFAGLQNVEQRRVVRDRLRDARSYRVV